jgi:hypothetical protein
MAAQSHRLFRFYALSFLHLHAINIFFVYCFGEIGFRGRGFYVLL